MDTNDQENSSQPESETRAPVRWGRRILIGGAALAALAGVGAIAATAQDFGGERMQRFGMGPHRGMEMHTERASWRGGGFAEHRFNRILTEIDATPEQSEKLKAIMDELREEVFPLARDFRNTREDIADLLGAATIDRAAAETLRSERVAALDEASRKLTTALLDAAEVLTADQRAELLEHFEQRGKHRRW